MAKGSFGSKAGPQQQTIELVREASNVVAGARRGARRKTDKIIRKYPLIETPSANYVQRTEWNVRDTGGTVILSIGHELTGGSRKTAEFAVKHNKPCLHMHSGQPDSAQALRDFVANNEIATLNVAGPRASKEPQVGKLVKEVLEAAFHA